MMLDKFQALHIYTALVVALLLISVVSRIALWLRSRRFERRWLVIGVAAAVLVCALLVGWHGDVQAVSSGGNPCLLPTPHIPHDPTPPPRCLPWSTATP